MCEKRPPVSRGTGLLILSAAAAAGCDRPAPQPNRTAAEPAFDVYDSAGVEIVVNHAPQRPRGQFWTIDPEPAFVLGETRLPGTGPQGGDARDPNEGAIWRVRGMARLADGRIAVLSAENRQLFLFEPSGKLSRTIGGHGRGPGEFVRPEHLWYLPPDTLMVWDYFMGPVTRFDTAGRVLDRRHIDLGRALEQLPDQASPESRTIALPDGSFLVRVVLRDRHLERPPDDALVRHPPVEYVRLDNKYAPVSLGIWPGPQRWVVPERLGRASAAVKWYLESGDHLHQTSLATAIAAGGHPTSVYLSPGDRNEIRQFSLDGTLLRIIRRTAPPVRVTERAHRADQRHSIRVLTAVNSGADWYGPIVMAQPMWKAYPPIHGMVVDTEGRLWVREWSDRETGVPDQWSVFSSEGRWLGVLDEPASPTAMPDLGHCQRCWIGKDFFLTLRRDDWGGEQIEAYRIRRDG